MRTPKKPTPRRSHAPRSVNDDTREDTSEDAQDSATTEAVLQATYDPSDLNIVRDSDAEAELARMLGPEDTPPPPPRTPRPKARR